MGEKASIVTLKCEKCVRHVLSVKRDMHTCLCGCVVTDDIFGLVHTYAGIFASVAFSV